jgi:hypothetical protein
VTGPQRIGGEVERELRRFGPALGMADIVSAWPDAVGDQIARNAWPARLARDGTLYVNAASSAWVFELGQLAGTVLERLQEKLGDRAPAGLRFKVGHLPETTPEPTSEGDEKVPRPGPRERAAAADLTAAIDDDELRELVARAAAASLAKRV